MTATQKIQVLKIREAFHEGLLLAEERYKMAALYADPGDGDTPWQAVEPEVASVDCALAFDLQGILQRGLEAFEELHGGK